MPVIKNREDITTSKLRGDILDIIETGYESILTEKLVRSKITMKDGVICIQDQNICIEDYEKLFLVSVGKCAVDSAKVFEDILGDRITGGIVLDVKKGDFKHLVSEAGTHPFPSEKNVFVTKQIKELLKNATKKDLVIVLVSGGGSSLLCSPEGIKYQDQKTFSEELMKKGATIQELNTVRKHTSSIKGGHFATLAYPATVISFIMSDVPGDDLSVIASGPTVMDTTTIKDAEKIIDKYNMQDMVSDMNLKFLETPKNKKYFEKVINIVLGSNKIALNAMKKKAEELGYNTYIEDNQFEGEAKIVGKELASKEYLPNSCHLWGGETTVKVEVNGFGGRNQEFVLGALPHVKENMVVVAIASDGWDNGNVAGAIVDKALYEKALDKNIDSEDYLTRNASYDFFNKMGSHIITGRTGANVADWYLIIKGDNKKEYEEQE